MPSSSHPLPSTLILLNNLPSQPPGTKVRFLGWCGPSPSLSPSPNPNFTYYYTYYTYLPNPLSVAKYSIKTGLLALEHDDHTHDRHQQHDEEEDQVGKEQKEEKEEGSKIKKADKKKMVIALVDIKLVRGSMKARDTMKGEWLNVVGYIQLEQKEKEKRKGGVRVQALMVWSAEGVRLREYESAVEEREKLLG